MYFCASHYQQNYHSYSLKYHNSFVKWHFWTFEIHNNLYWRWSLWQISIVVNIDFQINKGSFWYSVYHVKIFCPTLLVRLAHAPWFFIRTSQCKNNYKTWRSWKISKLIPCNKQNCLFLENRMWFKKNPYQIPLNT